MHSSLTSDTPFNDLIHSTITTNSAFHSSLTVSTSPESIERRLSNINLNNQSIDSFASSSFCKYLESQSTDIQKILESNAINSNTNDDNSDINTSDHSGSSLISSLDDSLILNDSCSHVFDASIGNQIGCMNSNCTLCDTLNSTQYNLCPPTLPCTKVISEMPNEILLNILTYSSVTQLASFRLVNINWKSVIKSIFNHQLTKDIVTLSNTYHSLTSIFLNKELVSQPQFQHYSNFMRQISIRELSEATWYTAPPSELQIVCECLCLLSVNQLLPIQLQTSALAVVVTPTAIALESQQPSQFTSTTLNTPTSSTSPTPPQTPININNRMSWKSMKKIMQHFEFKQWIINLRTTCELIPIKNIKRVEQIIMNDESITYPRLREVSSLGYKLLIFVAAVLQYHNIWHALESDRNAQREAKSKLDKMCVYVELIKKDCEDFNY